MVRFSFEDLFSQSTLILGAIVGLISAGLAWAIGFFPATTIQLATIDLRGAVKAGVSTDMANRVLGLVSGSFTLPEFGVLMVAGILLVILGRAMYLLVPFGKTTIMRLAYIFAVGAMVGATIINGMAAFTAGWVTYVTLGLYSLLLAFVVNFIYENVPGLKLPPSA